MDLMGLLLSFNVALSVLLCFGIVKVIRTMPKRRRPRKRKVAESPD